MALIRDVIMNVPSNYSNWDISRRNRLDVEPGLLYPVFCEEVLPGDRFKIFPTALLSSAPLLAPLMSSHRIELSFFFVPTRLYVQSMDINRLQFTPAETKYPTFMPPLWLMPRNLFASNISTEFRSALFGIPADISVAGEFASFNGINSYFGLSTTGTLDNANYNKLQSATVAFKNGYETSISQLAGRCITAYLGATSAESFPTALFYGDQTPPATAPKNSINVVAANSLGSTVDAWATAAPELALNAIPLIGYYDIFRNYYANTQESTFFLDAFSLQRKDAPSSDNSLRNASYIYMGVNKVFDAWSLNDAGAIVPSVSSRSTVQLSPTARVNLTRLDDFIMKFVQGETSFESAWYQTIGWMDGNVSNSVFDAIPVSPTSVQPALLWAAPLQMVTGKLPSIGLCHRTYSPDLNTVWLNQATYSQMLTTSAINVNNDQVTVQQIRTASKLLQYDERGLVAGGRYDDWVYSQFGRHNRGNLCIPEYLGRYTSRFVAQDVVSTNASLDGAVAPGESTTLGQLGGKGYGSIESRAPITLQSSEHGYILGIFSLTPEASYSSGYQDLYDKTTFGDIYAPILDRIGFQPRQIKNAAMRSLITAGGTSASGSAYTTPVSTGIPGLASAGSTTPKYVTSNASLGYQPAWAEYTTALDRAYGAFSRFGELNYWVLTRAYAFDDASITGKASGSSNYSSYVFASEFEYPFADQQAATGNFYVQLSFDAMVSRRMSKTIMPTLS